jgi:hypothetical protein
MNQPALRSWLFVPSLPLLAILQGCSDSRSAPVAASGKPATIPYSDYLGAGGIDWPDISQIRNEPATAPSTSPTTVPTSAPSAKFSADVDEVVRSLIVLARKLTAAGEYGAALRVCEAILLLDPKNDYAIGVRPLLEDRGAFKAMEEQGQLPTPSPWRGDNVRPATQPSATPR